MLVYRFLDFVGVFVLLLNNSGENGGICGSLQKFADSKLLTYFAWIFYIE